MGQARLDSKQVVTNPWMHLQTLTSSFINFISQVVVAATAAKPVHARQSYDSGISVGVYRCAPSCVLLVKGTSGPGARAF
jgi:hypothetical protein